MHLIQIFIPLADNEGNQFSRQIFADIRTELVEHFKGLTAHSRAPADGVWKSKNDETSRDQIVIYEVMAANLDRNWWTNYRQKLEAIFHQEAILIRASEVDLL